MNVELFELYGVSFLCVMLAMTLLWGACCYYKNMSFIDLGWGLSFFLIATACLIFGDGEPDKKLFVIVLMWLWSGLLVYLQGTYMRLGVENPGYARLLGGPIAKDEEFKVYLILLFQGMLALILSTPIMLVSGYAEGPWQISEGLGMVVWLLGVCGEVVASRQRSGKKGLWRYLHRPNFFFEWMVWVGFFLIALPSWGGEFAVVSPFLIGILYFFVPLRGESK